ncbi:biotin/lipoyl-containing protein [Georgenia yuyongxinii]|uniref:Biotin/lipoyl-binding protein n=1 Tax=Georgenia yuyongxinii TaxID=2589797 RepID=A0A552WL01_9MICO|nr:lipoyl domain-containing protein [Georgenia yuyongxinii]TRW43455.1 biotin/lipoyl-binding protein [Georgenia yuyongxinii]
MTDVPFPPLSEAKPDTEGVLATWYVADGDQVVEGQLLAEVQVDKVDAEVAAPAAGTVHLLVGEDESVLQGAPIARID